jgi:hypothetical protein
MIFEDYSSWECSCTGNNARKIMMTAQLIKAKRIVVPQVLKIFESIVKKLKLALEDYKYQSGMIPEMALPRS